MLKKFIPIWIILFSNSDLISQVSKPIAYFPFDGNTINSGTNKTIKVTTANMKYGYNRFGTANSTIEFISDSKNNSIESYIYFENMNDVVPNGANKISYAFWIKNPSYKSDMVTFMSVSNPIQKITSSLNFLHGAGGWMGLYSSKLNSAKLFEFKKLEGKGWHFIVISFDKTNVCIYQDGILLDNKELTLQYFEQSNSKTNLCIGGEVHEAGNLALYKCFTGQIDDFSIYDKILSIKEQEQLLMSDIEDASIKGDSTYILNSYKNYISYTFNNTYIANNMFTEAISLSKHKYFNPNFVSKESLEKILNCPKQAELKNTPLFPLILKEKERLAEEKVEYEKRKNEINAAEAKRVSYIKKATVGDLMIYTQDWEKSESYLLGFYKKNTPYTMIIKCYIERIEGEKFQLRIADVSSTNKENYSTPEINGIKINKGDFIWIKPFKDKNWFWGEDE